MAIKEICPCDYSGMCPYNAEYNRDCEYWCGAPEPEDYPDEEWYEEEEEIFEEEEDEESDDDDYEDDVDETGFNPYMGCYDYDC